MLQNNRKLTKKVSTQAFIEKGMYWESHPWHFQFCAKQNSQLLQRRFGAKFTSNLYNSRKQFKVKTKVARVSTLRKKEWLMVGRPKWRQIKNQVSSNPINKSFSVWTNHGKQLKAFMTIQDFKAYLKAYYDCKQKH